MDSSEYTGFTRDSYVFAEPKENIVAFVTGSFQHDLFLMKSTDYGETFEKTLIWDHPYDILLPTFDTDTFYCADGSVDVLLDINGPPLILNSNGASPEVTSTIIVALLPVS